MKIVVIEDVDEGLEIPEDVMYCIEMVVEVNSDDKTTTISVDSVIVIPANEVAGIKNRSDEPVRLLYVLTPPDSKISGGIQRVVEKFPERGWKRKK